jgi:hypothetical protein
MRLARTALPDWIVKCNEPAPLQPSFCQQAISTRVHAFVMAMIDGCRSITDMARLMEEQHLMTSKEVFPVIREFLIKILDQQNAKRPGGRPDESHNCHAILLRRTYANEETASSRSIPERNRSILSP